MHAVQKNISRYGFALASVAFALGVALLTWHYGIRHQFSMFLFAIAVTAWYWGAGPAILGGICSTLAYDYFFREPAYSLSVRPQDIPDYVQSVLFMLMVVWFGAARRGAEDALRRSEKRYRELIEASPDAIFLWDADCKCVLANASAAKLRGCSPNELIGLSLADTYVSAERDLIPQRVERLKQQGVIRYERQFLRENNAVVPVEVSWSTAGEDQSQTVLRDISDRKKAEEILRERASLLDLTHDTVFVRDMNNVITYWNRGAEELYGWTRQEAVDQVSYQLLRTIFPEPLEKINAKLLRVGRWEGELVHATRDDRRVVAASRWSLQRDERGNPIAILETNNDVSERKKAEEALHESDARLEEAQRIAHVGYWELEIETGCLPWSDESYRIFGLKPQERTLDFAGWQELIHPEDRQIIARAAAELVSGEVPYNVEYRVLRPSGEVRIVHSQGDVVMDQAGWPRRVFGTIQDITERRRAEEALQKTQAELAHVTRLTTMGELASSIAHQVNQPLTAIVTSGNACLRWLSNDPPNMVEARELVSRIVKDGHRASEVVRRIRGFFEKGAPRKLRLDINDLIRDVIAMVPDELRRDRVRVMTELTVDLPAVSGDPIQLQQVLLNLVINGIEAMSNIDAGRELLIKSQRYEAGSVLVAVQDNGVGYDEQNADQLFEAFYTTKPNGLGMGLSISRTTIEAYGGRLWATMNNGGGATFQFILPASEGNV